MTLTAGTRLGPYLVEAPIGAGGMGEVYRARDTRLNRGVAIKVLPAAVAANQDRVARFEREAQAVAALSHPNILAIHDVGVQDGVTYAVTELLDGETLRDRLKAGPLPTRKAIDFGVQLARGLAAAHDKGLIHRDLKPENLFLLPDGQLKILDFGLAKASPAFDGTRTASANGAVETVAATDPGTVLGTVGYMSPEQVRGQDVDARADIFAVGAVLYEMLSGERAFHRDTAADSITAILNEDPPDLTTKRADLSPALDRIVRHCLEKNPAERFQSARDVAFALEALSGTAVSSASIAAIAPGRAWLRPALVATAVIAAIAVGIAIGRAFGKPPSEPMRFTMKTFEPQSIFNARFMPGGEAIVFSSALSGNTVGLFEIRSGTLEPRPFGPPRTHLLSVSSKGELAVLVDARFLEQRLFTGTLARMSLEGAPRAWMDDVREADWSPDGSTLAVVHTVGLKDRLEYPIGKVLYETAGYISDPRVSPDGTRVAFLDHQVQWDDRGWVKVVDRAGAVTTVAGEFWGAEGLAWSPDGSTLHFGANGDATRAGAVLYQVHSVPVRGTGGSRHVLTTPGDFYVHDVAADGRWLTTREDSRLGIVARGADASAERDLTWLDLSWSPWLSSDGQRVLFTDGHVGANYGVVWRTTDGSPITRLGEGNAISLSPDGRFALANVFTPPALVLYPVGAGEPVRLDRGPIDQYRSTAFWFPDGKSVVFVANEPSRPARVYRQDIAGGTPKPFLTADMWPAAMSPDGQTILGKDASSAWQFYPVSGAPPRAAKGLTKADVVVCWDGRAVFVRPDTDIPAKLERVDSVTGTRTLVKELAPVDRAGLIQVQLFSYHPATGAYSYDYAKRVSTLFVVEGAK
jgi:Tol biopolymer transport system component